MSSSARSTGRSSRGRQLPSAGRQSGIVSDRGRAPAAQPSGTLGARGPQAGRRRLSINELVRLKHIVIEEDRFIKHGLRDASGFIGCRDWNNDPSPEHVSARHEDVADLLQEIIECGERTAWSDVNAVLQASVLAFPFVFIHPFEDGNGRLHRYMIHHGLAERGYAPRGMIYAVSSVLLKRQAEYGEEFRAFTGPLLPFIEWAPTEQRNGRVLNETADLYRFGDYTEITEFPVRVRREDYRARPAEGDPISRMLRRGKGADTELQGNAGRDDLLADQLHLSEQGHPVEEAPSARIREDDRHGSRGGGSGGEGRVRHGCTRRRTGRLGRSRSPGDAGQAMTDRLLHSKKRGKRPAASSAASLPS